MTYFNEELLTKIRSKDLDKKMETLVLYLLENDIDSATMQADRAFFDNASAEVIYPYIARAVLSTRNRMLLEGLAHLTSEEAANDIFMTFLRRLDSLIHSIYHSNGISMHQTLHCALHNMVIDLVRKENRRKDDLQNDLFWEKETGYLMSYDLSISAKDCSDILLAAADLKAHHLLAFLGLTVAECKPEMLWDALNRKGNTAVLQALIRFAAKKYHLSTSVFCCVPSALENRHFTAKELSDLNSYAKKVICCRLTKKEKQK